jgi:hypothetical protein
MKASDRPCETPLFSRRRRSFKEKSSNTSINIKSLFSKIQQHLSKDSLRLNFSPSSSKDPKNWHINIWVQNICQRLTIKKNQKTHQKIKGIQTS